MEARVTRLGAIEMNFTTNKPLKTPVPPPPTKQKECLAFLGSLNYYRASLPWLKPEESADKSHDSARSPAAILDPLYKLATSKEVNFFKKAWQNDPKYELAFKEA